MLECIAREISKNRKLSIYLIKIIIKRSGFISGTIFSTIWFSRLISIHDSLCKSQLKFEFDLTQAFKTSYFRQQYWILYVGLFYFQFCERKFFLFIANIQEGIEKWTKFSTALCYLRSLQQPRRVPHCSSEVIYRVSSIMCHISVQRL